MSANPCPPMRRVDQTILLGDPKRKGNCVAAAIACVVDLPLDQVPHFIEFGISWGDSADVGAPDSGSHWWAMMLGYLAGRGIWIEQLPDLDTAQPDEVLLVAGMTERGVMHQVVYRGTELWHDPHPSHAGLTDVREVLALRALSYFDHSPTPVEVSS